MKYVIFEHRKQFIPVVVPEHCTHSQVHLEEATAVSAGFFNITPRGVILGEMRASSLNLGPDLERDTDLLESLLNNSGVYAFLHL